MAARHSKIQCGLCLDKVVFWVPSGPGAYSLEISSKGLAWTTTSGYVTWSDSPPTHTPSKQVLRLWELYSAARPLVEKFLASEPSSDTREALALELKALASATRQA